MQLSVQQQLTELAINRISDNVDPCQALFERTAPCTPKSAISLSLKVLPYQPKARS